MRHIYTVTVYAAGRKPRQVSRHIATESFQESARQNAEVRAYLECGPEIETTVTLSHNHDDQIEKIVSVYLWSPRSGEPVKVEG